MFGYYIFHHYKQTLPFFLYCHSTTTMSKKQVKDRGKKQKRGWDNSPISYIKSEQTKILIVRKPVLFAFFVQF